MDKRKEQLLNLVIESHIAIAEPIGSRFLLSGGKIEVGEATIRNELRQLEEEGYLTHPHTSAGRIPTAKGYRYYIDNLNIDSIKCSKKDNDVLGMTLSEGLDFKKTRKDLAKKLSEISNQTVVLSFSPDSIYYTGISNLFSQPEFKELELVANVSAMFDHCEKCLDEIVDELDNDINILIGTEHTFGEMLSVFISKFSNEEIQDGIIAILGPLRMDYKKNYALMNKVKEII